MLLDESVGHMLNSTLLAPPLSTTALRARATSHVLPSLSTTKGSRTGYVSGAGRDGSDNPVNRLSCLHSSHRAFVRASNPGRRMIWAR